MLKDIPQIRNLTLPKSFPDLFSYKSSFIRVINEHIQVLLNEYAIKFWAIPPPAEILSLSQNSKEPASHHIKIENFYRTHGIDLFTGCIAKLF